jgi:hypothetical protein
MLATDRHPGRAQRLAGLLAICALVAGCSDVAAPSSGSPSVGATPSMSMATDSPTRTSSEPSPSPTPDAAPTQPADGDDGWRSAGTVATARTATDAAELGDGRVLVMGEDAETYVNDEVVPVVADTVEL